MVDKDDASFEEDWRSISARMWAKLRRIEELQRRSREIDLGPPVSPTLIEVTQALCDRDAPPPTAEELRWLKDNLVKHQQSVEKLIGLIERLLSMSDTSASD